MQNSDSFELLYDIKQSGASFNRLAYSIVGYQGPTIFIFQTKQGTFGIFQTADWKDKLGKQGDDQNVIFTIDPSLHFFRATNSEKEKLYAYLNTKFIDKSQFKVGLGWGVDQFFFNYQNVLNDFRIWIDDDLETGSYIGCDDETYQAGMIAQGRNLNILGLEIWGLGGKQGLMARETYRIYQEKEKEKMRRVDKKEMLQGMDRGLMMGNLYKHEGQMIDDIDNIKKENL